MLGFEIYGPTDVFLENISVVLNDSMARYTLNGIKTQLPIMCSDGMQKWRIWGCDLIQGKRTRKISWLRSLKEVIMQYLSVLLCGKHIRDRDRDCLSVGDSV